MQRIGFHRLPGVQPAAVDVEIAVGLQADRHDGQTNRMGYTIHKIRELILLRMLLSTLLRGRFVAWDPSLCAYSFVWPSLSHTDT